MHEYSIKLYSENSKWCNSLRNKSWSVKKVEISRERRGQNSTVGSERSDNIGKDEIMF